MKNLKSFLKKIDGFGVHYLFRYKTKKKYTTPLGGIVIILFYILLISFVIFYFVPFALKKNFTSIYYITNLQKAPPINLNREKSTFSIGLTCENKKIDMNSQNLFELETKFITKRNINSNKYTSITNLISHSCLSSDFNKEEKEDFDKFNLSNNKCFDNNDLILEGTDIEEVYSYYEFTIKSKSDSKENLDRINALILNQECNIQFIYQDINIDLNNYKTPIKYFLSSINIQLYPNISSIHNIFFMNQYLINDDYIFGISNDDNSNTEIYASFSRYEKYILNNYNSNIYAKIFIKADNRKTYIKRKYQKFIEFFADISSIFVCIYSLLNIIIHYINEFYSELSLSKKIFIFKDAYNKNIDFSKKVLKIQQLISLTNQFISDKKYQDNEDKIMNKKTNIYNSNKNNNVDLDIDDFEISRIKNEILGNMHKSENQNSKENSDKNAKIYNNNKSKRVILVKKNSLNSNNSKNFSFNSRQKMISREVHKTSLKKKDSKTYDISSSSGCYNNYIVEKNRNSSERSSETRKEEPIIYFKKSRINYKFNLLEIIKVYLFKRCISENLKTKIDLNIKANNLLYNKLDIIVYIKSMLLFDIIIQMLLDSDKKYIANFLCRPIIPSKNMNENELEEFYNKYDETEFVKSNLGINKIIRNYENNISELKLIELCNKQLKDLL